MLACVRACVVGCLESLRLWDPYAEVDGIGIGLCPVHTDTGVRFHPQASDGCLVRGLLFLQHTGGSIFGPDRRAVLF